MKNHLGDTKNPYTSEIKTKEDALKMIKRGIFYKQNRIEKVFHENFKIMRQKIHKVLSGELDSDELTYHVYVNSILVDCRAMFLENPRYKFNSTLQSTYKARGLEQQADEVDKLFDEFQKENGKTLKETIKSWVDQRVVHYDYLEDEEESKIRAEIEYVISRTRLFNIFHKILIIANHYEKIRQTFGENTGEQVNKTLEWLTGGPDNSNENKLNSEN